MLYRYIVYYFNLGVGTQFLYCFLYSISLQEGAKIYNCVMGQDSNFHSVDIGSVNIEQPQHPCFAFS